MLIGNKFVSKLQFQLAKTVLVFFDFCVFDCQGTNFEFSLSKRTEQRQMICLKRLRLQSWILAICTLIILYTDIRNCKEKMDHNIWWWCPSVRTYVRVCVTPQSARRKHLRKKFKEKQRCRATLKIIYWFKSSIVHNDLWRIWIYIIRKRSFEKNFKGYTLQYKKCLSQIRF